MKKRHLFLPFLTAFCCIGLLVHSQNNRDFGSIRKSERQVETSVATPSVIGTTNAELNRSYKNRHTPVEMKSPLKGESLNAVKGDNSSLMLKNYNQSFVSNKITLFDAEVSPTKACKISVESRKLMNTSNVTVTFAVYGEPLSEFGENIGFQMLFDADALFYQNYFSGYYTYWDEVFWDKEYSIPVGASSYNLDDPSVLLVDGVESITVPEGVYDLFFTVVFPYEWMIYIAIWEETEELAIIDDFTFMAGHEYIFEAKFYDYITYEAEYDAMLTEIILPPPSFDLSDQEEITITMKNNGEHDFSNVNLCYKINNGVTVTELYPNVLIPGESVTYTFDTKANFSNQGMYFVDAWVVYLQDLNTSNNKLSGTTKKYIPFSLPFTDDFSDLLTTQNKWTEVDANKDGVTWIWINDGNFTGCDGLPGHVQVNCSPAYGALDGDDYLITDPIIIPEAGPYYMRFMAQPWGTEYVRILYGTSPDYDEMEVLKDYIINVEFDNETGELYWLEYIVNFEIEDPDIYYFAIHYHSVWDDWAYLINIDNFEIDAGPYIGIPDLSIIKTFTPISNCDMSDEVLIGITLYNVGTNPVTEFTFTYQIGDNEPVSQVINEMIDVREYLTVYHEQPVDFSEDGKYVITFTVETQGEENTFNNIAQAIVYNFEPVKQLPWEITMGITEDRAQWNPYIADTWRYDDFWTNYYNLIDNVPLLSRCIYLQPGVYRFAYNFQAGLDFFGDVIFGDFYVSYGLSGTDPSTWQPEREYFDLFVREQDRWDDFTIIITEEGEYQFGFFPTNTILVWGEYGTIRVYGTSLIELDLHDFRFNEIIPPEYCRITPAYHAKGTYTYNVSIENRGSYINETGLIEVILDDNLITSSNFEFLEIGEVINIDFITDISPEPGEMKLKFNGYLDSGIDKTMESLRLVSDSTFATDYMDIEWWDGVGYVNGNIGGLGMIYEFDRADIITSITVGLLNDDEFIIPGDIGFAVYDVDDYMFLGKKYFEVVHPRTLGNNNKAITFDVPDTQLEPGKYYIEVQQLDINPLGIVFDYYWQFGGHFYGNKNFSNVLEIEGYFGNLHIRPNFGKSELVGISQERVSDAQLTLYPNPVRGELRIENGELRMEKITIYNTAGQVVQTITNVNNTSYSINTEMFSSGLYFISVQTERGIITSKFTVK